MVYVYTHEMEDCNVIFMYVHSLWIAPLSPHPFRVVYNCTCYGKYLSHNVIITDTYVYTVINHILLYLLTAYSGTAPGDNMVGYNVFIMENTVANIVQFLVSTQISVEENLYVVLVVTILAVPLFTVADIHYGSGTRRNICGRKKPVVAESGNIQCESVSSGKENGTLRVVFHFCVLGGDHCPLALCILHSHSSRHACIQPGHAF